MRDVEATVTPFHRLLSTAGSWSRCSSPSPLHSVSADVLLEVVSYLSTLSDILHFGLASWKVYCKVIPAVYASVELQGPAQCEATLGMFQRCPEIARHVQKLVVRPEKLPNRKRRKLLRAWDNAGTVSRLVAAAARRLDVLQVFEWDGEDMLPDDRMWADLRLQCPYLRRIGTTFGCFLPRPNSHLFKFNDLIGFSLTFKDGFYAHQLHVPSRESAPVFTRLWDMLILRCPDLESLVIAGTFIEPSDAGRIRSARWHRLRTLTIGDVEFGLSPALNGIISEPLFAFLEEHPTLEGLHILGPTNVHPLDLAGLNPSALPRLTEFSGSLDHLRALIDRRQDIVVVPNQNAQQGQGQALSHSTPLAKTLRHVSFLEPMQMRELTPLAISRVLMDLHALTSLKITFALHNGYDSNGVFRTIVASCPQLLHLDLVCTSKPSFYLVRPNSYLMQILSTSSLVLSFSRSRSLAPSESSLVCARWR
ncbi:hypothetical protein AcV5_007159 [Taiwanofungus camphoratus]|nr:hypothetical protein AcV5_007159 [Antrodia cinnamomea]